MGQDCQSGSSRMLTFCLSNYASLTDMSGTGCIINTLDNFIVQALHQFHGSAFQ